LSPKTVLRLDNIEDSATNGSDFVMKRQNGIPALIRINPARPNYGDRPATLVFCGIA
jgi:hypothetical protein